MADEVGSAYTQPLVVVSADTHAGPLLKEQLRAYCPQRYLAAFDDYVRETSSSGGAAGSSPASSSHHGGSRGSTEGPIRTPPPPPARGGSG